MTSKEYYKQTSDMAFLLDDCRLENGCINANVFVGPDKSKTKQILCENDFFSIKDFPDGVDACKTGLNVTFVYGKDYYDVYRLSVCDTIDCRIGGGLMVYSCDGYELVDSVRPSVSDEKTVQKSENKPTPKFGFSDVMKSFDDMFGLFPSFDFSLPSFDKMVENAKNSGGKCVIRQYTNDNGHETERVWCDGKLTEREAFPQKDSPKAVEKKDTPNSSTPKDDLKNLLK